MDYQIYYSDKSTYNGPVETAPTRDVQAVVVVDNSLGWYLQTGSDYYVWADMGDGLRWWGVDIFGLFDYLIDPGWKRVLFGRMTTNARFSEIVRQAKKDFGPKHGWKKSERRP